MKYDEGPTAEVDVYVDAPIERVWSLVVDINLPARFSAEFQGADWVDEGPRIGASFIGRNFHSALGEWETTSFVDRYEPPFEFGWRVSDPDYPSSSWWFELKREGRGVRLRQGGQMGPAPSGLSVAIAARPEKEDRIVARRLEEWEAGMRATVEGIKTLAEEAS